ncbi:MAG TPA: vitamin K epoxide reductase family protein [Patescibacteria group bacterium]
MERKMFFWVKILSLAGIFLALFLLWEQFFHPAFQPCNINSTINCNAVISGVVSKTFGIPTPLIGLVGYIVIFIAAVIKNKKLLLVMATFGLLFCLYLAYVELFQLYVVCPVCIGCQIIMIAVFTLGLLLNKLKGKSESAS